MFGAKWVAWSRRDDRFFQITGRKSMLRFEAKNEKFILYPLSDWQPM